jgi:NAD(P)-dependent dehydrogenase (short-subunit alcohol dehydrogenase family)
MHIQNGFYMVGIGLLTVAGQSKLANILFTKALSKKYRSKGITVYSVHPGLTKVIF